MEADFDVGQRLRGVREMHSLSQRELAKRAGVTNGTISLIEQNRVSPSIGSLRKVLPFASKTTTIFDIGKSDCSRRIMLITPLMAPVGCPSDVTNGGRA